MEQSVHQVLEALREVSPYVLETFTHGAIVIGWITICMGAAFITVPFLLLGLCMLQEWDEGDVPCVLAILIGGPVGLILLSVGIYYVLAPEAVALETFLRTLSL